MSGASSNTAIAKKLGISIETAKVHIRTIMELTGMSSRLDLALWIERHPEIFENKESADEEKDIQN